MRIQYLTFMVRNLDKTIEFYHEIAGLKVIRRFNPGAGAIVFMGNSEDEKLLEFIEFDNVPKVETKGMDISFSAGENLIPLREKAIALGYKTGEIISHPPKPDFFRVYDPDGIAVEFTV